MTSAKTAAADELRMSGKTFDRIMRKALQVRPEDDKKAKGSGRAKKARKKRTAKK